MTADIKTDHLFFKCEQFLFSILSHIREVDLELILLLGSKHIKQRKLTAHARLFLSIDRIYHLHMNMHLLKPGAGQRVKSSGLYQRFDSLFVHGVRGQSLAQILQ